MSNRVEADGFAVVADVIDEIRCDMLASHLEAFGESGVGSRVLLVHLWCQALARDLKKNPHISAQLPLNAVAVQCTLFDKSPTKNWLVSLHQDLSVPVKRRIENPEYTGWTEKQGQVYVQPPVSVLEELIAVRVHVDECPAKSGALRVVEGSHAFGRLDGPRADELRKERGETVVPVSRGGALVMRPLILHASSKAAKPGLRRVLHFVFGPPKLPLGLDWQWAV